MILAKKKLIIGIVVIIVIAYVGFLIRARYQGYAVDINLYSAAEGNYVQAYVNESLLIDQTFEADTISRLLPFSSTEHRYLATGRYCSDDSLIKVKIVLYTMRDKRDTVFCVSPRQVESIIFNTMITRSLIYQNSKGMNPFDVELTDRELPPATTK
ncbi:hypothetical protein QNI16_24095 [Cytophagaceae bacterium YF14B1]|uniref:Uncharacterized protein n=1 Tax=Xanthocytophaga flava TaxID=3048013 RepID=A0AAE3U9E7_9BACT|nr:hypothetical protein [Xanthocytophaga flavus]MDJ1483602.1 hypothetical protein [Xanthocytophaga flavus]